MNNLRITTTDAKIGIRSTRGYYTTHSPKGEQTIKTTKPQMTLEGEKVKVIIDSYEPWSERGFKNNLDLLSDTASYSKQMMMQGLSRRVADGNRMADIRKSMPPAIPEIAEKNSKPPMHEFNFGLLPTSKPKITVVGGQKVNWRLGNTEINYTQRKPEINYTRGKVETYMEKYPEINIEYIDTRA